MYRLFLFFISNSKRETENNVREYQELQQVLVCGFLKVQFKALTPFPIQSCRFYYRGWGGEINFKREFI
jgi:hypothetical protein